MYPSGSYADMTGLGTFLSEPDLASSFFCCLKGQVSLSTLRFSAFLHNDPGAHQDHCGRCWIQTRGLWFANNKPPHLLGPSSYQCCGQLRNHGSGFILESGSKCIWIHSTSSNRRLQNRNTKNIYKLFLIYRRVTKIYFRKQKYDVN